MAIHESKWWLSGLNVCLLPFAAPAAVEIQVCVARKRIDVGKHPCFRLTFAQVCTDIAPLTPSPLPCSASVDMDLWSDCGEDTTLVREKRWWWWWWWWGVNIHSAWIVVHSKYR